MRKSHSSGISAIFSQFCSLSTNINDNDKGHFFSFGGGGGGFSWWGSFLIEGYPMWGGPVVMGGFIKNYRMGSTSPPPLFPPVPPSIMGNTIKDTVRSFSII